MFSRSRRGTAALLFVAVLGLLLLSACSTGAKPSTEAPGTASTTPSTTPTPEVTNEVKITSSGFKPASLTVKVRSRVTWVNEDKVAHNVAFSADVKSGNIPPGQRASHIFGRVGSYQYQDALNPSLKGVVIVE